MNTINNFDARGTLIDILRNYYQSKFIITGEMQEYVNSCVLAAAMKESKGDEAKAAKILGTTRKELVDELDQVFSASEIMSQDRTKLIVREKLTKVLTWLVDSKSACLEDMLDLTEYATYLTAMRCANGNQSKAAKLLGVGKGTVRNRLVKHFGTTLVGCRRKELDSD